MNQNHQRHLDATGASAAAFAVSLAALLVAGIANKTELAASATIFCLAFGVVFALRLQTARDERTILLMMRDGFGWTATELAICSNGALDPDTIQRHLEKLESCGVIQSRRHAGEPPTGLPCAATIYFLPRHRLPHAARKDHP